MGITIIGSPKSRLSLTQLSRYYVLEAHAQALEADARRATGATKAELMADALAVRARMIQLAQGGE